MLLFTADISWVRIRHQHILHVFISFVLRVLQLFPSLHAHLPLLAREDLHITGKKKKKEGGIGQFTLKLR